VTASDVGGVLSLYERWGDDRYDEEIAQLEHALQTAALAADAGASDELVVAALLHDIGHLLALELAGGDADRTRDLRHEAIGARHLANLFPPEVTAPIALHVRAKRYLCAVDVDYHAGLSDGSRRSLQLQGGPFGPGEVAAFERLPGWSQAVELRRWDDRGKVDGLVVQSLADYVDRLERVSVPL
jgi:phosphonate degradation associated HDIG domain protein